MFRELWTRCSLAMHLYGEGGRWSLTCIPRPSLSEIHMERGYNSLNKRPGRTPEGSADVSIDRK
jgi:hypothetical protein